MEVKSDLSKVRVGDILRSLRHGVVKVIDTSATHIHGQLFDSLSFCTAKWTLNGKLNPYDVTPDLYYPGVQIIPAESPKRMKKVTIEKWMGLYRGFGDSYICWVSKTGDGFPVDVEFLGEPHRITWEIEVEDV